MRKFIIFLLLVFFIIYPALFVLKYYVVDYKYMDSDAMFPAIKNKGLVFINKSKILGNTLTKKDVIVFNSPIEDNKYVVRRLIATEGDEVKIKGRTISVNGEELDEPYVYYPDEKMNVAEYFSERLFFVPDNNVFVLGDNRNNSKDSRNWYDTRTKRYVNFINVKDIKGKVINY